MNHWQKGILLLAIAWISSLCVGLSGLGKSFDFSFLKVINSLVPFSHEEPLHTIIIDIDDDSLSNSAELWTFLDEKLSKSDVRGVISFKLPKIFHPQKRLDDSVSSFVYWLNHEEGTTNSAHTDSIAFYPNFIDLSYQGLRYGIKFDPNNPLQLAVQKQGDVLNNTERSGMFDFKRWNPEIPRILISDFKRDKIPASLLEDKWIILNFLPEMNERISVPLWNREITEVEFFLLGIESIYNQAYIDEFSNFISSILCFGSLLLAFHLFQRIHPRWLLHLCTLFVLGVLLLIVFVYCFLNLWVAPSSFIASAIIVAIGILYFRYSECESLALNKSQEILGELSSKIRPEDFLESDHHWESLVGMIQQYMAMNKSIFLRRVDGKTHLQEVYGYNCSLDDINEVRRDFERDPYKSSIEQRKWKIDSDYLPIEAGEVQYLIPLSYAGEIIGFWAFVIDEETENTHTIKEIMTSFSDQVAELLYFRNRWDRLKKLKSRKFFALFSFNSDPVLSELKRCVEDLLSQYKLVENVFHSIHSAAVLYDAFGYPIQTNGGMDRKMQELRIRTFELSSIELIGKLTGENQDAIRFLLRKIIRTNDHFSLPCDSKIPELKGCLLAIRTISNAINSEENALPVGLNGLLVEVVDVRYIYDYLEIRQEFLRQSYIKIRQEMAPLGMASDLMEDAESNPEMIPMIKEIIQDRNVCIADLLESLSTIVEGNNNDSKGIHPIRADNPVQMVLEDLKDVFKNKELKMLINFPTVPALVMANLNNLKDLVRNLILVLLEDAYDGSEFVCEIKEEEHNIFYRFSNQGVGMNHEEIQSLLYSELENRELHYQNIYEIIPSLADWSAELHADCSIGTGIQFDLRIKKLFNDAL